MISAAAGFEPVLLDSKSTTLKNTLNAEIFQIYYQTPHDMGICRWSFQDFTEIKNVRHGSTLIFSWARKLIKIFFKFYNHISPDM